MQGKPLPVLRRSSALLDPFVWMIAAISVTKAECVVRIAPSANAILALCLTLTAAFMFGGKGVPLDRQLSRTLTLAALWRASYDGNV